MQGDSFAELADLRREAAVCSTGRNTHLVLRHAEAIAVLRDHHAYTGALTPDDGSQRILHELDLPDHPRVRAALLFTGLARDLVEQVSEPIAAVWADRARGLARGRPLDLVSAFTRPGVRASFALVAGIPAEDQEQVYAWVEERRDLAATTPPGAPRGTVEAFDRYLRDRIAERRRDSAPPDDLFTRLLFVEDPDGGRLSDDEIVMLMSLLCQAGIGSTSRSLGNLLHALIREPALYARVRADRALVDAAVEESLRHDPPGLMVERVCRSAGKLAEASVEPGDVLMVHLGSANRDESVFDAPEAFDIDRPRLAEHVSFGRGRHRCVGAPLARLVLRTALGAFLDRVESVALAPGWEYRSETFGRWGPRTLEVEWKKDGGYPV